MRSGIIYLPVKKHRTEVILGQVGVVAAIKKDTNKALAALTSAALSLPGLSAQAAIPSSSVKTNISYGHYQESDDRMQVDIYHADAVIPLSDRLEVAFSLDRDTYSGATPAFSLPETVVNQPKYGLKNDGRAANEVDYADLVSAASSGVTATDLTLFHLNQFTEYADGIAAADSIISDQRDANITNLQQILDTTQQVLKSTFDASSTAAENTFFATASTMGIGANIPDLIDGYKANRIVINTNITSLPETISGTTISFPGRTAPVIVAYGGGANLAPVASGNCPGSGSGGCYYENGMVIGIAYDPSNPNPHLHLPNSADNQLSYHSDSSGIYLRSQFGAAFDLVSMDFHAPIGDGNYIYGAGGNTANPLSDQPSDIGLLGAQEKWEIFGFSSAVNPALYNTDGYSTAIALASIPNGFSGTVGTSPNSNFVLGDAFKNVAAVWIHYNGYPKTPSDSIEFAMTLDNIVVSPVADLDNLKAAYEKQLADLNTYFSQQLITLASNPAAMTSLLATHNQEVNSLTANYQTATNQATQNFSTGKSEQENLANNLIAQATIDLYRKTLDQLVPDGTPTVQRFQLQPQETRSMPQFTARYYFDNTTLGVTGGLSDEPDFLSNFGSVNISHELNEKLTTINAGYGLTSNQIDRGATSHSGHANHLDSYGPADYPALSAESTFHNFNAGFSQVLGKNTLYNFSTNFSHQTGYLSNPYKYVYVRGEVTPEEYYQMFSAPTTVDWNSITSLEMVGLELFREKRPDQRNIWSFSNRLNQYIPQLDAAVHLDYRFFVDDWGVNSHTFELKWYQSLPGGWTVTPGLRYYSQSQADFFAPYFLSPRADGNYTSDFRLSAFGDLSGGVTVSKQFARGISVEAGMEYVTHSGSLKLGGGGVGDYADFNYYMAHANLSIDLGARPLSIGEHSEHNMHHHHHGAPVPAGVMFGHMMNQADDIMIGYRYQYSAQNGSMRNGSDPISDALLVSTACAGNANGCLYKPTNMHMQMHMLDLMYAPTDWLNIMLMPQLMSMDMGMSQPLRPFEGTEEADYGHHAGTTHNSNDIGDTVVTALVKIADDGKHHLHTGIGMSAPTGAIDAQLTPPVLESTAGTQTVPNSAVLQDYGMQLGSGTWDFKPSLTYTGHLDDWGWGGQLNGVKRLGKNKYGYAYGDIFQATGWGSYNIFNWLSATVRGVYTWQDKIQGATTQNHENVSPVDFTNNYGGQYWDVGMGLNLSVPEGQFAGHNLSVEWLQPVASDFNGSQLDRDGALTATWSYTF